ncbi:hypothetical protein BRADI_2g02978v3 [Brachypodium distachyon]|uniref:Uncharacterized protein n=1 Tax=Brachypodium distachyon TaxID=15368 RepID=A0A2K2D6L1_BRADI|nr:hypothetical protein BRADI_2g02978v3 [Brachypodium distachyon]
MAQFRGVSLDTAGHSELLDDTRVGPSLEAISPFSPPVPSLFLAPARGSSGCGPSRKQQRPSSLLLLRRRRSSPATPHPRTRPPCHPFPSLSSAPARPRRRALLVGSSLPKKRTVRTA